MIGFVAKLYTEGKKEQVQNDLLKNLEGYTLFLREKRCKIEQKDWTGIYITCCEDFSIEKESFFFLIFNICF